MTSYTSITNNWVNENTIVDGKITQKLLGLNCPHCQRFFSATDEDSIVDAQEHQTYCNPAHRRAEVGERW
jgi:hypothetical protein